MVALVNTYADLIEKGLRTIEQVPSKLRDDVQAELDRRAAANGQ